MVLVLFKIYYSNVIFYIALENGDSDDDSQPSILEMVLNGVIAVTQIIAQSSYIGTNIIMMV